MRLLELKVPVTEGGDGVAQLDTQRQGREGGRVWGQGGARQERGDREHWNKILVSICHQPPNHLKDIGKICFSPEKR